VATKTKEVEDAKAAERVAKRAARLSAERERQLKPVQDAFNRGKDLEQLALKNLKEQSKALNDYNAAVREFKAIQHEAERLTRSHSDDTDFTAELDSLSQQAQDELINCLLS